MTRKREMLHIDRYEEDGYAYLSLPTLRDPESPWDWMKEGQCLRFPDLNFFEDLGVPSHVTKCKIVCDTCVVKKDCLDFAQRNREPDGIWGGLTPRERKERRK